MRKIWILILAITVFACGENHDFVTESGVEVACIEKGDGEIFVKDSVLLLKLRITTEDGKVLIESGEQPMPILFDPSVEAGHIQEVLNKMEVGDSVYFQTTAENLYTVTYRSPIPDSLEATTNINIAMKATDMMSQNAYMAYQAKMQEEKMAGQLDKDIAIIDAYLEEQGIEAQTTASGLRYIVTDEGNGTFAEAGDRVFVNYAGKLLDGAFFDTSIEEVARENGIYSEQRATQIGYNPLDVVIGRGQVIKGWDEGILLIPEGGKGTLYIPSPLGYGARGSGAVIKPYSVLEFDVEVVKVEKPEISIN